MVQSIEIIFPLIVWKQVNNTLKLFLMNLKCIKKLNYFVFQLLMFWVTDNFLMHRSKRERRATRRTYDSGLLNRVKVRYRSIRSSSSRHSDSQLAQESDSEQLISADEELLGSFDTSIQQRSINASTHHQIT